MKHKPYAQRSQTRTHGVWQASAFQFYHGHKQVHGHKQLAMSRTTRDRLQVSGPLPPLPECDSVRPRDFGANRNSFLKAMKGISS